MKGYEARKNRVTGMWNICYLRIGGGSKKDKHGNDLEYPTKKEADFAARGYEATLTELPQRESDRFRKNKRPKEFDLCSNCLDPRLAHEHYRKGSDCCLCDCEAFE